MGALESQAGLAPPTASRAALSRLHKTGSAKTATSNGGCIDNDGNDKEENDDGGGNADRRARLEHCKNSASLLSLQNCKVQRIRGRGGGGGGKRRGKRVVG